MGATAAITPASWPAPLTILGAEWPAAASRLLKQIAHGRVGWHGRELLLMYDDELNASVIGAIEPGRATRSRRPTALHRVSDERRC